MLGWLKHFEERDALRKPVLEFPAQRCSNPEISRSGKLCLGRRPNTLRLSEILRESGLQGFRKAASAGGAASACACWRSPVHSSVCEVLDLVALVFGVRICLVEVDPDSGLLEKSYFGKTGEAQGTDFEFYLMRKLRAGPRLKDLRRKLQSLRAKSRSPRGLLSPAEACAVDARLRRVEDCLRAFRSYSFSVLRSAASRKRKAFAKGVLGTDAQQTQATVKTTKLFSSSEKVQKGGN